MRDLAYYAGMFVELQERLGGAQPVGEIIGLGNALLREGFPAEAEQCLDAAVRVMLKTLSKGKVNIALSIENLIYVNYVRQVEKEEHYKASFDRWSRQLGEAGAREYRPGPANRIAGSLCFVIQTGVLLGHTSVMLKTIACIKALEPHRKIMVIGLGSIKESFVDKMKELEIPFVHFCRDVFDHVPNQYDAAKGYQETVFREQMETVIWVSTPTMASYIMAMRAAPRQVFWSLKLHPIYLDSVDVHICGGTVEEEARYYHGQKWSACPFPLTVDAAVNDPADIDKIRAKIGGAGLILGTLAREEKYNSPVFMSAVCGILARNPKCKYVWTGRNKNENFQKMMAQYGVEEQCHYVGWVDTNVYAEVIDIFLETFPFGCGVTGFQAMSHETPVISYFARDTLFGYQLWNGRDGCEEKDSAWFESLPIMTAKHVSDYERLCQLLIDDESFREKTGRIQYDYYCQQVESEMMYSKRFIDLVS